MLSSSTTTPAATPHPKGANLIFRVNYAKRHPNVPRSRVPIAHPSPSSLSGNQNRRRPPHPHQRRLALLQRRSRRRRAASPSATPPGVPSTCPTIGPSKAPSTAKSVPTMAPCPSSASPGIASTSLCPPPPRAVLTACNLMAPCRIPPSGSTARSGRTSLRLRELRPRPHASSSSARRTSSPSASHPKIIVALVSRRRHLSQCLARDVTGPVHVAHWGTYITTPESPTAAHGRQSAVDVAETATSAIALSVENEIYEPAGKRAANLLA